MLNITPIRGDNQYAASHYFASGDDYYSKEHPGLWQGKGAEALGLGPTVEQAEFSRLLAGVLPDGSMIAQSFSDDKNKKRMGIDLTFSAPKSISLQALVGDDARVLQAHDAAVTKALLYAEELAVARRKVKGKSYRERTANMVIGKFRHEMSRAKDPQLHTHAVILNMTQRADGKWRALSNEDVFALWEEVDGIYKTELAKSVQELGYQIRVTDDKGNFDLAHITRAQIEAFSERSRVIEEALANEGKTRATATTLEKQIISLATRPRKDERDRELIKRYWHEKSKALDINFNGRSPLEINIDRTEVASPPTDGLDVGRDEAPVRVSPQGADRGTDDPSSPRPDTMSPLPKSLPPAQAVLQYAINHLTEREAIVTETRLVATALHRAVGLTDRATVKTEIERMLKQGALIAAPPAYRLAADPSGTRQYSERGWQRYLTERRGWNDAEAKIYVAQAIAKGSLVAAERRYTTHKALQQEKAVLAIERDGRSAVAEIVPVAAVKQALEATTLNADQRNAAQAILASVNRFVGIQGDAGTGKSYTLKTAHDMLQAQGWKTVALAPYGTQVKSLRADGLEARTLASFLRGKDKAINEKTVVLLDEAGVVPTRQLLQLMRIVEKSGARLVMMGDTKQTQAIESGKPFAQLQNEGMQTVRIREIQRQEDKTLKEAVQLAADGLATDSLGKLKGVHEIDDATLRRQAMVEEYLQLSPADRRGTLIIVGTNEAKQQINDMVRKALELEGKGIRFDTLQRVDMTQAQRRFAPSYQPGMVVQPERDYASVGMARGELYHVLEAKGGNLLQVKGSDGVVREVNPRKVTKLSVYEIKKAELSVGDVVRVGRNDAAKDLTNGDVMQVVAVQPSAVSLAELGDKGAAPPKTVTLSADKPLHVDHIYAMTAHSSQGATSSRVIAEMLSYSRTTSMNLYYVAISRAKHEVKLYTNDLKELPAAISQHAYKTTALTIQRAREAQRATRTLVMQRAEKAHQRAIAQRGLDKDGRSLGKYS